MKKLMVGMLLMSIQHYCFSEEFVFDFQDFPAATFGPPGASGFTAGNVRFFPIRAEDGDIFYHIHAEDIDRNQDKELVHHADAGGWFIQPADEVTPFAVKRWVIEKIKYTDTQGPVQPLVVDGYLAGQKVATVEIPIDITLGSYEFPDEFGNLDKFEVYFKTWRGKKPADADPNTGVGGTVSWNISIDDMVVATVDPITNPPVTGVFPKEGMWWNPKRSGHGLDIEFNGTNLAVAWYTYNDDGTPTWYLAAGPFSGTNWTEQLSTFTWDGTKADGSSVGTITLEFTDPTHASFSWVIDGVAGNEPIEYFVTSSKPTSRDYTGLWFEPTLSGYGLTVSNQGDTEFSILYFYNDQGQPRWVLGVKGDSDTYVLEQFTEGFCPVCDFKAPQNTPAGTITRSFSSSSKGALSTDIDLTSPLSGAWKIDNAQIVNLSNP